MPATRRGRLADGREVPSYVDEQAVDPARCTETFAELAVELETPRWTGHTVRAAHRKGAGRTAQARPAPLRGGGELELGIDGPEDVVLRLAGAAADRLELRRLRPRPQRRPVPGRVPFSVSGERCRGVVAPPGSRDVPQFTEYAPPGRAVVTRKANCKSGRVHARRAKLGGDIQIGRVELINRLNANPECSICCRKSSTHVAHTRLSGRGGRRRRSKQNRIGASASAWHPANAAVDQHLEVSSPTASTGKDRQTSARRREEVAPWLDTTIASVRRPHNRQFQYENSLDHKRTVPELADPRHRPSPRSVLCVDLLESSNRPVVSGRNPIATCGSSSRRRRSRAASAASGVPAARSGSPREA